MQQRRRLGSKVGLVVGQALLLLALVGCSSNSRALRRAPPTLGEASYMCGNQGRYMSPFTRDGTLAKWVDKGLNIKAGSLTGMTLGGIFGKVVSPDSPLGPMFAASIGGAIGRNVAIEAFGGWTYIQETSDMSFNYLDEMAIYLYREFHASPNYLAAMQAAFLVYPRLRDVYPEAVRAAVLGAPQVTASTGAPR